MELTPEEDPPARSASPHVLIAYTTPMLTDALSYDGSVRRSEADELAGTADQVRLVLESAGYTTSLAPVVDDLEPVIARCRAGGVDVVFNLVDAIGGADHREWELPAVLARLGVRFTGARHRALRVGVQKDQVRALARAEGLPMAPARVIRPGQPVSPGRLRAPWFVKPARSDGSIGIDQSSVVHDLEGLRRKVEALHASMMGPVLVEEYLPGPELNVAFLPGMLEPVVTLMDFSEHPPGYWPVVTYACKWQEGSPEYVGGAVPAEGRVCPTLIEEARHVGARVLALLGNPRPGRVDLRADRDGRLVVMDVNPNPDIAPDGGFMRAMGFAGLSFSHAISAIVEHALLEEVASHAHPRRRGPARARRYRAPAQEYAGVQ